jgi:enoyl-CoA hydratase/carnithine racemase
VNEPLDLTLDGPLAVVSLNAPPLNLFDVAMRDELLGALQAVNDIGDVKAMVLRAEGRHFSAGADLAEFGSAASIFEARRIRWDRDPWGLLWELRVPTVAALHGTALGSGLEMALLCDLRLAAPDTMLGLPETKLGMLPAAGGTQSLTRAIGPHPAVPIIALGTPLGAGEAAARGLVHEVVDDVDGMARRRAEQLALLDRDALGAARRALRAAADLPLDAGLAYEKRLARALGAARAR